MTKSKIYTTPMHVKCSVRRPKYAKDKTVKMGMRLYHEDWAEGILVARTRAPRNGGNFVGYVLSEPGKDNLPIVGLK